MKTILSIFAFAIFTSAAYANLPTCEFQSTESYPATFLSPMHTNFEGGRIKYGNEQKLLDHDASAENLLDFVKYVAEEMLNLQANGKCIIQPTDCGIGLQSDAWLWSTPSSSISAFLKFPAGAYSCKAGGRVCTGPRDSYAHVLDEPGLLSVIQNAKAAFKFLEQAGICKPYFPPKECMLQKLQSWTGDEYHEIWGRQQDGTYSSIGAFHWYGGPAKLNPEFLVSAGICQP